MIEPGSARKYLFYSIGEIALVVIGILIALQVNNWNEYRKERTEERSYLTQLLSELQSDSISLNSSKQLATWKAEGAKENIDHILLKSGLGLDTVRFIRQAFRIGIKIHHYPSLPTYEELVSSGKLNLIQNEVLKTQLTSYVNRFRKYFELGIYLDSRDYSQEYNNHIRQYFPALMMQFIVESLHENSEAQISISQLEEMGLDMIGYLSDSKSVFHLNNVGDIHLRLSKAYEGNLENLLGPLIEMVRMELD